MHDVLGKSVSQLPCENSHYSLQLYEDRCILVQFLFPRFWYVNWGNLRTLPLENIKIFVLDVLIVRFQVLC